MPKKPKETETKICEFRVRTTQSFKQEIMKRAESLNITLAAYILLALSVEVKVIGGELIEKR